MKNSKFYFLIYTKIFTMTNVFKHTVILKVCLKNLSQFSLILLEACTFYMKSDFSIVFAWPCKKDAGVRISGTYPDFGLYLGYKSAFKFEHTLTKIEYFLHLHVKFTPHTYAFSNNNVKIHVIFNYSYCFDLSNT